MLADLKTLKAFLRVSDNSQDPLLTQLLATADRAVKLWTKRDLETTNYTGPDAEYRNGNGATDLHVYQRPVRVSPPGLTGNVTSGSAVITGLSLNAQTYLAAGMPAQSGGAWVASTLAGAFPPGTTVASVDSATQVTCSANATASGTAVPLVFGLRVFLDPGGFGGDGISAFATASSSSGVELFLGLNYALSRDSAGGKSRSAVLTRLGGAVIGGALSGLWPGEWPAGFLSAKQGSFWPRGVRNIRIEYTAGLGAGAPANGPLPSTTTLPVELTTAVCMVAGYMRTLTPQGVPLDTEAVGRQVLMQLQGGERDAAPEISTVRQMLRNYRELAF